MKQIRWLVLFMALLMAKSMLAQFVNSTEVKAHDFEGVTIDGQSYHLFDSQAERILVCFWSVDCEYCHYFLKKLRRHTNLKKDYEFVTFALAESQDDVRKEVKKLRLPGLHFYDEAGWDAQPFLDYDVNTTPTVILIDKDKNVVGEAYDWEEFEELEFRVENLEFRGDSQRFSLEAP